MENPNRSIQRFRIRPATNHLGSPCSRCGFLAYRIPFEVIDSTGKPLCMSCARKHTLPLYKGLVAYHDCITSDTLSYTTDDRCYYIRYGSIKSREEARKQYLPYLEGIIKKAIQYGITGFYWMHTDHDNATIHGTLNNRDAGESRINRMVREAFDSFEPMELGVRYLLLTDRYEVSSNIDQPSEGANDIPLPSDTLSITKEMEQQHIGYIGVRRKTGELASIEHQGAFVCESEPAVQSAILTWCAHPETFDIHKADFSMLLRFFRRKIPCALDRGAFSVFKDICEKAETKFRLPPFEEVQNDGFAIVAISLHHGKGE